MAVLVRMGRVTKKGFANKAGESANKVLKPLIEAHKRANFSVKHFFVAIL